MIVKFAKLIGGWRAAEKYDCDHLSGTRVSYCSFASCMVLSSTVRQKGWCERERVLQWGGGLVAAGSSVRGWGPSWNLCRFALRHLGVSKITFYFFKANKSGFVLYLPGLAGNPLLVMSFLVGCGGKYSFFLGNRRRLWESGTIQGKLLVLIHLLRLS